MRGVSNDTPLFYQYDNVNFNVRELDVDPTRPSDLAVPHDPNDMLTVSDKLYDLVPYTNVVYPISENTEASIDILELAVIDPVPKG